MSDTELVTDRALDAGETAFYDCASPALAASEYQILVQQTVQIDSDPPEPSYASVQRFRVAGPRLGLAPNDVVARRPGAGVEGDFSSWLPHAVLAERTLPWQVPVADPGSTGAPPATTPWLALLVLTRDEIDVDGAPPDATSTGTQAVSLTELLEPPAGTAGPTGTAGLLGAAQEQPSDTCTVVDVFFDAFRAVAPQTTELAWLTHVRQVDTADQEELDVPAPGWYSVVVANRLPVGAADNAYVAHLVSVEGLADLLPDHPAPSTPPTRVRLVSLASWSFSSAPGPGDFDTLMKNVSVAPMTVPATVTATDAAGQLVSKAIAGGYTAVGYRTRWGEETAGWYRGPVQPVGLAGNPQPAFSASSSALLFDPAAGMFDLSYAAAWEIGRLLTLANGPVTQSLLASTSAALATVRLLLERARRAEDGLLDDVTLRAGAVSAGARRTIAERLLPALLGLGDRVRAFGIPADPTGLRDVELPGLLDPAAVMEIVQSSADPLRELLVRATERWGGADG